MIKDYKAGEIIVSLNVKAALLKLSMNWPDNPEALLQFKIVEQAIWDLNDRIKTTHWCSHFTNRKATARKYLEGPMTLVELCGVKPSYIKFVCRELGVM